MTYPAPRAERTCPSCKIRHRVPRLDAGKPGQLISLSRSQLAELYRHANEFIEAGGGETYDIDEACEECGRWSVIAFLDWIKPDVEKVA